MLQTLYTVYDRRAEEAGPVFGAKNDSVAMRQFIQLVQKNGLIADEYQLWAVAIYDTEKMTCTGNLREVAGNA